MYSLAFVGLSNAAMTAPTAVATLAPARERRRRGRHPQCDEFPFRMCSAPAPECSPWTALTFAPPAPGSVFQIRVSSQPIAATHRCPTTGGLASVQVRRSGPGWHRSVIGGCTCVWECSCAGSFDCEAAPPAPAHQPLLRAPPDRSAVRVIRRPCRIPSTPSTGSGTFEPGHPARRFMSQTDVPPGPPIRDAPSLPPARIDSGRRSPCPLCFADISTPFRCWLPGVRRSLPGGLVEVSVNGWAGPGESPRGPGPGLGLAAAGGRSP